MNGWRSCGYSTTPFVRRTLPGRCWRCRVTPVADVSSGPNPSFLYRGIEGSTGGFSVKFIVSVVNRDDVLPLIDVLVTNGYGVTTLKSAGGFLRKENVTLFTGVEDEQVEDVVRLIQDNCHTR
ncbi:MAG TPA: hypothetical protein ENI39_05850, partial [Anaerolineae bacterium]|nr:hypothetical protein [Anaerolineae bacterium]